MARQEEGPHLFTVEEVNRLLPQVGTVLRELRERRDALLKLEEGMAVEQLSWLREDGTVSPKAQEGVKNLEERMEGERQAFEEHLERLGDLGAQLKDLDEGLVDFFAARGETLIYLCWKEGEDRIRFWHDLESGFAGRQPLERL
ncbi:MAG: DUF2203 domain-containing protein [Candidatus Omnitrophica bacterium]|nr:DUF2203 domain-containing protein [Candidatus Omnitrophota bacterium]